MRTRIELLDSICNDKGDGGWLSFETSNSRWEDTSNVQRFKRSETLWVRFWGPACGQPAAMAKTWGAFANFFWNPVSNMCVSQSARKVLKVYCSPYASRLNRVDSDFTAKGVIYCHYGTLNANQPICQSTVFAKAGWKGFWYFELANEGIHWIQQETSFETPRTRQLGKWLFW